MLLCSVINLRAVIHKQIIENYWFVTDVQKLSLICIFVYFGRKRNIAVQFAFCQFVLRMQH